MFENKMLSYGNQFKVLHVFNVKGKQTTKQLQKQATTLNNIVLQGSYQKLWPHFVMNASSIISKQMGLQQARLLS